MRRALKKVLLAIAIASGIVVVLSAYVTVTVAPDVVAARRVLTGSPLALDDKSVGNAQRRLAAADSRLNALPAQVLRIVPVIRQNIDAVRGTVRTASRAVDALADLRRQADALIGEPFVEDGTVSLDRIAALQRPLSRQAEVLGEMRTELAARRSGWLLPPLWRELHVLHERVAELEESARAGAEAARLAAPMLGAEGKRTYLVLLLNNSELRGAGGIMSGIGTLTADDGRVRLGDFYYYNDLRDDPPRKVKAPPDLERRFGRYRAATTVWVNASASPDVPEVALVASRLFELSTGQATDGAIIIDPRGIAALLPPNSSVAVPGLERQLTPDELPRFAYSESYEELGAPSTRRRRAVLDVGTAGFERILRGGMPAQRMMRSAADAIRGQHIRFVSFSQPEQELLTDVGATGRLRTDGDDSVLVTVQNLGADKLDFWMRRDIDHSCVIDATASCRTVVRLTNETPRGLPDYVVQRGQKKYGLYEGYLEAYVPAAAELTSVRLNDDPAAEFYPEEEDGRRSLGMYFSLPREERLELEITYDLPIDDAYSLEITPQPLAQDARLDLKVSAPPSWLVSLDGDSFEEDASYSGPLDHTVRVIARDPGRTGLPALWQRIQRFWREPLL